MRPGNSSGTAHNIVPIRPGFRKARPDRAQQETVAMYAQMLQRSQAMRESRGDKLGRVEAITLGVAERTARGKLPAFNLRLIINERDLQARQFRRACVACYLAQAKLEYDRWRDIEAREQHGGAVEWTFADLDRATDRLAHIPARTKQQLKEKRHIIGRRPGPGNVWQSLLAADEARLCGEAAAAKGAQNMRRGH